MNVLLRNAYYLAKPWLPLSFRIAVRRWMARRKRAEHRTTWPINPALGRPPVGWPGWPEGKQFALVLTHDVESSIGLERCFRLSAMESRYGLTSCFYFIPEGHYSTPRELRERLAGDGFEVGVHDLKHDGRLFLSRKVFQSRSKAINHYLKDWKATGFRSGFMLHNLEWLKELEIEHDASTFDTDPFQPQPEGIDTIFPFRVSRADGSGYVEMPSTLPQDFSLFTLLGEGNIATWKKKLDWIAEQGGMALLNTHPDYMSLSEKDRTRYSFPALFYDEFLQYVHSKYDRRYWHALPRDVAAFVRARCSSLGSGADRSTSPAL